MPHNQPSTARHDRPLHHRRRAKIGALIDALPDEPQESADPQQQPEAPSDPTDGDQAIAEHPSEPHRSQETLPITEDSIPTAAELFAITGESIQPTIAPVMLPHGETASEALTPSNSDTATRQDRGEATQQHDKVPPQSTSAPLPLGHTEQPNQRNLCEPDPQAVINRLISTAMQQGSLLSQQRQLLAATLPHLPARLARDIRLCLADSMLGQTDQNDDIIVLEEVAESENEH
jgi:hypothetical protein